MIRSSEEFRKKATMYRRWKKDYENYCKMIEDIEYEESKIPSMFPEIVEIKGKQVAVPKTHGDPHQKEIYRLELIEHKSSLEESRDDYKEKYEEVEEAMAKLPTELRNLVQKVYIERIKIEKVAKEIGYSKNGLFQYVDKALNKYLKEGTVPWKNVK